MLKFLRDSGVLMQLGKSSFSGIIAELVMMYEDLCKICIVYQQV